MKTELASVMTELDAALKEIKIELKAEIATSAASLKVEIPRRLIVPQLALAGLLMAAMKFVR